jgi:hypothetical protein
LDDCQVDRRFHHSRSHMRTFPGRVGCQ